MNKGDTLLLTPGPVRVAPAIWKAISQTALHQRHPEFETFFKSLQTGLQYLFQTTGPVLAMPGSGTTAMEMTMRSLFGPGDKVVIQKNGRFSGRWAEYGRAIGLEVVPLEAKWGQTITVEQVRETMTAHRDISGWVLTHVETSTGMAIDLEEIAFEIREKHPDQVIVVDAICSAGIQAFYLDDWGIDAAVAASQKGLGNPAGTCFVALRLQAVWLLTSRDSSDGLRLGAFMEQLEKGSYPFTPPVNLFFGIERALRDLQEETLAGRWNAIQQLSKGFQKWVIGRGGDVAGPLSGFGVTAFWFEGRDHSEILKRLKTEFNIVLAGGQGHLKGKILRVGHFGDVGVGEMKRLKLALEKILGREQSV
jgi:NAD-reducing hydrogenase large subunit